MDRRSFSSAWRHGPPGWGWLCPFSRSGACWPPRTNRPENNPCWPSPRARTTRPWSRRSSSRWAASPQFVKKDDRVVVKPNIGWDRTPEQAANTHPDWWSRRSSGSASTPARSRCWCSTGPATRSATATPAAASRPRSSRSATARAQCVFQDQEKFVPVKIENGKSIKRVQVLQGRAGTGLRLLHQRPGGQAPQSVQADARAEERDGRHRRQPGRDPQGHWPSGSPT